MSKTTKSDFIHNVNHQGLVTALNSVYAGDVPLMIWGAPGIGKSMTVRHTAQQIAESKGLEFIEWNILSAAERRALAMSVDNTGKFVYGDCRLSQYDPSDWALPWADRDGEDGMKWLPSQLLKAYSVPGTAGMLFLDELPQAIPAVQDAAYQIILDRCYKDVCFKGIRMVAAGNRAADGGNQYAFAPALANRMCHIELSSPYGKDWVTGWARNAGIHPLICAFISARSQYLYEETGKTENRRFAWSSPRSWEMASKLLNNLPTYSAATADSWISNSFGLLYMTVGKGAAMEFQAYMQTLHDVFLEDFLKSPDLLLESSVDVQLGVQAMLEGHTKHIVKEKTDKEKIALIGKYFDILALKLRAEIRGMFIGGMLRGFRNPESGKSGLQEISALLKKAGKKDMLSTFDEYKSEFVWLLTGERIVC